MRVLLVFALLACRSGIAETLYVAGDIAFCPAGAQMAVAARTSNWVPRDADVLLLGDLVYPTGSLANFESCYRPTWGVHDAHALPVPGNHEYYADPRASGFFTYFKGRVGEQGYYSFSRGSWLLIALNSNLSGEASREQLRWLDALLKDAPKYRCILAYWHHPVFASTDNHQGDSERMRSVWARLHAVHADIVLNGHEHNYEAFAPLNESGTLDETGPRQFIVGTGGAPLTGFSATPRPGSRVRLVQYAVMRLELAGGAYSWSLVAEQQVLDSGTGDCLAK